MERFLWICFAGAVGTGARYLITLWAGQRFGTSLPHGTLIANIAGCFLIGLVYQMASSLASFPPGLKLTITVGFLGGLTTYSSFAYETIRLAQDGAIGAAFLNFGLTTAACFGATLLGLALAQRLSGG
jgi:fluoride exporter